MKLSKSKIKILCTVLEAILATIAGGVIIEQNHPYWALVLLALARGVAAWKDSLTKQTP